MGQSATLALEAGVLTDLSINGDVWTDPVTGIVYFRIWGYLTRRDTGEGINGKTIWAFVDNIDQNWGRDTRTENGVDGYYNFSWTVESLGAGSHDFFVRFNGDATYAGC